MRKTKIICTMGPATDRAGVLEQLIFEGMNVARFNFSHGSYDAHRRRMDSVRTIRKKAGCPIAILLDTKGPEIRIGKFESSPIVLETGQQFTLCANEQLGNAQGVSVTYKELYKELHTGDRLLFDDGMIESVVEEIQDERIICRIMNSGKLSDNKGINVPGECIHMPYISKKDREDIIFGIQQDVDFIAASFVRTKEDICEIRELLDHNGGNDIRIIAKIENAQGIEHIDGILEAADGIMIARGDMGVELSGEEVPIIQKMLIKKAYHAGKIVITATQMLDSMMVNPRPTRAEVTDVANAIYDGTGAIMLSGETAAGKYPVEALETMVRIAKRTEQDIDYRKRFINTKRKTCTASVTDAICHAACTTAQDLGAKAIVVVTKSGYSARMISRYRPVSIILGCGTTEKVTRQLNLSWGVIPILLQEEKNNFNLFAQAVGAARKKGKLETGDIAVMTSGVPLGISGTTNIIKVEEVD